MKSRRWHYGLGHLLLASTQDWHLNFIVQVFAVNLLFKLHITTDVITLSAVQLHLLGNWIKCARVKTRKHFQKGPCDKLDLSTMYPAFTLGQPGSAPASLWSRVQDKKWRMDGWMDGFQESQTGFTLPEFRQEKKIQRLFNVSFKKQTYPWSTPLRAKDSWDAIQLLGTKHRMSSDWELLDGWMDGWIGKTASSQALQ